MDAIENLFHRRSIRRYQDKDIPDETLETVLKAAMMAPSAGNQQPWEFVVVRDSARRDALAHSHQHAHMAAHAPVVVVPCADTSRTRYSEYWPQDLSAATQNILLAANALGIGSVWVGVYPQEERIKAVSQIIALPENIVPFAIVPLGYPDESKPDIDRWESKRVHREQFS